MEYPLSCGAPIEPIDGCCYNESLLIGATGQTVRAATVAAESRRRRSARCCDWAAPLLAVRVVVYRFALIVAGLWTVPLARAAPLASDPRDSAQVPRNCVVPARCCEPALPVHVDSMKAANAVHALASSIPVLAHLAHDLASSVRAARWRLALNH